MYVCNVALAAFFVFGLGVSVCPQHSVDVGRDDCVVLRVNPVQGSLTVADEFIKRLLIDCGFAPCVVR